MVNLSGAFEKLFSLPRTTKKRILLLIDLIVAIGSVLIASLVILQHQMSLERVVGLLWLTPAVYILVGLIMGNYRTALRFIDNRSILSLIFPVTASSVLLFVVLNTSESFTLALPLTTVYFFTLLALVGFIRLLPQIISRTYPAHCEPVIIYGAGAAGRRLLNNLNQDKRYRPCALVDDNKLLTKVRIDGIRVYHASKLAEVMKIYNSNKVLLAIPSSNNADRKRILKNLETLKVSVKTLPGLSQILSEPEQINKVQDIDINDLLGRDPVTPNDQLMHKCITNKAVLVTGAGGSIGSELCRQIIAQNPSVIVLYEVSEFNLYKIDQDLQQLSRSLKLGTKIIAALGDVKNLNRLDEFIKTFNIQTIYHAAAYKHVPIVEHNVTQGVHNNVIGSYNVAKLACDNDIETCVLVSTDKAVRPTNVMGATKRLSELSFQAFAKANKCATTFSMVRFGNVLGSSGSVVPLFREQIKMGGPITVTHKEITRFFMTIPEASQLVIQAGAMAKGGEVFVLDMGEPVKIYDLAKKMVHLMGKSLKTENDESSGIEVKFNGLRPGEKLYEELLISGDVEGTEHSRIMMSKESDISLDKLEQMVALVKNLLREQNTNQLLALLLEYCDGFDHKSGNNDYLHLMNRDAEKNQNKSRSDKKQQHVLRKLSPN
ncbi:MAG: polysaccharide biosynthesis protein [Gammaproteobacteria bacterium]|nr:polysaccharide biosynthesis protein [Gammaproteobacteria bacterium]